MAQFYDRPVRGHWQYQGYPDVIQVGDILFRRAEWSQDYPGVVAQYREDRLFRSHHLKVHSNGSWEIDHVDLVNPDRGPLAAFVHLVIDAIPAWMGEFVEQVIEAVERGMLALGQGVVRLLEHAGFPALTSER